MIKKRLDGNERIETHFLKKKHEVNLKGNSENS